MTSTPDGVPVAVLKRLQLALAGYRFVHGRWSKGASAMSEELVDRLPVAVLAVLCGVEETSGLAVSAMN